MKQRNIINISLAILVLLSIITSIALFFQKETSSPSLASGNTDVTFVAPFVVSTGTLTGDAQTLLNFSNQTTSIIDLGKFTEYTLWINCSGFAKNLNVTNITTIQYEVSPDNRIWINGSGGNIRCVNNLTRLDVSDKSFRYMRLNIKGSQEFGTNINNSFRFVVSAK